MDGAKKWSEGVLKFHWGTAGVKIMTRPIVWKIFMTVFLLGTLGGGYGIILNKIKNF